MKTVVLIPTYNEAVNIVPLIRAIKELKIEDLHMLVVDDNSPDGTGRLVQELGEKDKTIYLLQRKKQRGRGLAGIAGFKQALKLKADYIVEMDADFSHDPKYIPLLLNGLKSADMVLGSRAVAEGNDSDRPLLRRLLTKGANWYIRIILGIPVHDCNSGFRAYKREVLERIDLEKIMAKGPDIVQEMLYRVHLKKFHIIEVPIAFIERKKGASKLGFRHLYKGYLVVLKLKMLHLLRKL